jgi:hypothetical protein
VTAVLALVVGLRLSVEPQPQSAKPQMPKPTANPIRMRPPECFDAPIFGVVSNPTALASGVRRHKHERSTSACIPIGLHDHTNAVDRLGARS